MKLGFVAASLLFASTAYAQAPGDYYGEDVSPPGMTPTAPAPTPVVVAPPERPMRWSVGLGIGSVGLAPHNDPENETDFSVAQLAVRYRATRHLEIELAIAGGREQLDSGDEGDNEVSQAVLALRYRFMADRPWNWWLMAGMGALTVASQYATDDERAEAQQSTLQFGVGLERRFHHFALNIEARAVGVAPNDESKGDVAVGTVPPMDAGGAKEPVPVPFYPSGGREGLSGGQLTLGVSYYF